MQRSSSAGAVVAPLCRRSRVAVRAASMVCGARIVRFCRGPQRAARRPSPQGFPQGRPGAAVSQALQVGVGGRWVGIVTRRPSQPLPLHRHAATERVYTRLRQNNRKPALSRCCVLRSNGGAMIGAGFQTQPMEYFHVRQHARNAGSRCPLRSPNPLLEPQDGPLYLRPPQQDPHHQPGKVAATVPASPEVRPATRGQPSHHFYRQRQAREILATEALRAGMPFVDQRWLGGMLTNFKTVKTSIKRLKDMKAQQEAGLDSLSKKEQLTFSREIDKLEKDIGGIQDMSALPNAIFVIDVGFHKIAVAEAKKLGIALIGVVDTNHSPEGIDYVIPGNDDSAKAVALYARGIADAIIEGRANAINEVVKAVAPESADEFVEVDESAP